LSDNSIFNTFIINTTSYFNYKKYLNFLKLEVVHSFGIESQMKNYGSFHTTT